MTRSAITLCSVLFTLAASSAFAQAQPTPEQMAQMLEEMRPTTQHQELAKLTGRWNQEVTWSMGGPPVKAAGIVTNRTIVGYDSFGTYYVTAAGKRNTAGLLVMHGETLEHEAGTTALRKYDMTLRVVDANTYVTEVIFKVAGQPDQTVASVTHRRVQ